MIFRCGPLAQPAKARSLNGGRIPPGTTRRARPAALPAHTEIAPRRPRSCRQQGPRRGAARKGQARKYGPNLPRLPSSGRQPNRQRSRFPPAHAPVSDPESCTASCVLQPTWAKRASVCGVLVSPGTIDRPNVPISKKLLPTTPSREIKNRLARSLTQPRDAGHHKQPSHNGTENKKPPFAFRSPSPNRLSAIFGGTRTACVQLAFPPDATGARSAAPSRIRPATGPTRMPVDAKFLKGMAWMGLELDGLRTVYQLPAAPGGTCEKIAEHFPDRGQGLPMLSQTAGRI